MSITVAYIIRTPHGVRASPSDEAAHLMKSIERARAMLGHREHTGLFSDGDNPIAQSRFHLSGAGTVGGAWPTGTFKRILDCLWCSKSAQDDLVAGILSLFEELENR